MEKMGTQVNGSTAEVHLSTTLMKLEEYLAAEPVDALRERLGGRLQRLEKDMRLLMVAVTKTTESGLESGGERNEEELKSFLDSVLELAGNVDLMVDQISGEMDESNRKMLEIESDVKNLKVSASKLDLVIEGGPVVGLEADEQLVMSKLISDEGKLMIVGIVGAEGMGKTHIARNVYESDAIASHFPCRAWVDVGSIKPPAVLHSLVEQVVGGVSGGGETEYYMEGQRKELRTRLRKDRFLIVLDDVPTLEEWIELQEVLFYDNDHTSSGSRVVITTRSQDIVKSAGPDFYIHEKKALSDEEGWELFKATFGFEVPVGLEDVGRAIVRRCMGSPREISALGVYLSKKNATNDRWSEVLESIKDEDDHKLLFYALDSAAEALPEDLKQCLFCFGLFHENYDIPARRLLVLWVADMLLKQDDAEKLLQGLVEQKIIQVAKWKPNGNVKTCRINYLLRDNWLSKAEEAEFLHSKVTVTTSSRRSMIYRLADHPDDRDGCFSDIHGNQTVRRSSITQYYSKLVSFLSFDSRDGPVPGAEIGSFLTKGIGTRCFMKLQIIDLEDVYQPKLPNSIGELVQLRYLGLRNTKVATLPSSVGNLRNLYTLDLKRTRIRSLPRSIWKMPQLRHLYLEDRCRCKFVFRKRTSTVFKSFFKRSGSSLVKILTLSGVYVDEETPVEEGLDRLINLKKLGLVFQLPQSQQSSLSGWITNLVSLEYLKLKSLDENMADSPTNLDLGSLSHLERLSTVYLVGRLVRPSVVEAFPSSLTEITLSFSGLTEDPIPKLEKLQNLRILSLLSGSYTGETMVFSTGGFPLLRLLNLWKLENLQNLIVEEGAMKILKEMDIRSCYKLKNLPECLNDMQYCREVKLMYRPSEEVQHPEIHLESFSCVERLSRIHFCGRLVKQTIIAEFPSSLTEITLSLSGLTEDPTPMLGMLPSLRILKMLSTSYTGEIIHCSRGGFPELQILNLEQLEELKNWIIDEGAMPTLKNVEIKSCNKLNMLPEGLRYLHDCRELRITDMPNEFKARAIRNQGLDWHKIEHIPSLIIT